MLVLDTNIISEFMRARPAGVVVDWLDAQEPESVWITSITMLEIRYGLELLDDKRRRLRLEQAFDGVLGQDLAGRILSFDPESANRTARISALARRRGLSIELRDAMIAGISARHGATLVTRNVRHFADCGIELIDPWHASD